MVDLALVDTVSDIVYRARVAKLIWCNQPVWLQCYSVPSPYGYSDMGHLALVATVIWCTWPVWLQCMVYLAHVATVI